MSRSPSEKEKGAGTTAAGRRVAAPAAHAYDPEPQASAHQTRMQSAIPANFACPFANSAQRDTAHCPKDVPGPAKHPCAIAHTSNGSHPGSAVQDLYDAEHFPSSMFWIHSEHAA